MSHDNSPKPDLTMSLGQLITELYEQYRALYDGDQDMVAVRTAETINRVLEARELGSEDLPD